MTVVYLVMIYGIGGIALVTPVSTAGFVLWDGVFAFLLAFLSIYVYYKHPGRVEKALQLGFIDYQLDVSNEMLSRACAAGMARTSRS